MSGADRRGSAGQRRRKPQRGGECEFVVLFLRCCCFALSHMPSRSTRRRSAEVRHEAQALTQPDTQMGRAMQLPEDNATLRAHPKMMFRHGAYSYVVETREGRTQYTVSDGIRSITVPVIWAMGAQAQTWVLEHGGRMYESMVSYYPMIQGLDVTVGDDRIHATTLEEAIGRPLDEQGVTTCFGCHATDAVVDHKLSLTTMKPGLSCEHCHVGASEHFAAATQGDFGSIPPNLKKMSSEDISNFCGQCHRTWELVVRAGWRGPANVRFQPYRLANSRCFDGTDARIRPAWRAMIRTRRWCVMRRITIRSAWHATRRLRPCRRHMRRCVRWRRRIALRATCRRCRFRADTLCLLTMIFAW